LLQLSGERRHLELATKGFATMQELTL